MDLILDRVTPIAKAIVAAVVPILSVAVTDALTELSATGQGLVATVATALLVWAVPNSEPSS